MCEHMLLEGVVSLEHPHALGAVEHILVLLLSVDSHLLLGLEALTTFTADVRIDRVDAMDMVVQGLF